jgi:hypothetical protein
MTSAQLPAPRTLGVRRLIGYLTIAATLPYLTLKLVWIGGGPLRPWIFVVGYGGFTAQGIGLTGAYARDRWATVFHGRTCDGAPGATRQVQMAGGLIAAMTGLVRLTDSR